MEAVEYGVVCRPDDEKTLVKHIDSFLGSLGYRKMYKSIPAGLRNPGKPEPRYSHYYWQMMKDHPKWFFDLYPNVDLNGAARFPHNLEIGWTLFTNKSDPPYSAADSAALDAFFLSLRESLGFPFVLLHTYQPKENRL
ncbi:hypothetical protein LVB77_04475 [Lysobacter sp. 5GHs7-4]|uniref:hypothetical protein n=1 Tax=Lysobacter sp. 5GHs7-4 TaxID=2904253 RepID=UPI001E6083D0|nr:hypothetical protein [Lysobacter sp. 5GHs7-4]UHQ23977.1 hypothetical protein LVB77_04475 [Lysobacter sp. 5GHs7-4]